MNPNIPINTNIPINPNIYNINIDEPFYKKWWFYLILLILFRFM